jgi:hypothetical protein
MDRSIARAALLAAALVTAALIGGVDSSLAASAKQSDDERDARHQRIVEHWTTARRAAAIPRDLVRDPHGQGYLRKTNGLLQPYGLRVADAAATNAAKPNAKPDRSPPSIGNVDPASNATVGSSSRSRRPSRIAAA